MGLVCCKKSRKSAQEPCAEESSSIVFEMPAQPPLVGGVSSCSQVNKANVKINITPPLAYGSGGDRKLLGYLLNGRYQPTKVGAGSFPTLDPRDTKLSYTYRIRRVASQDCMNALQVSIVEMD